MRERYKKLSENINLIKNKNFRNNQNYLLTKKLKKKIIDYAYFSNNGYYGMYSFIDDKILKHKLFLNELAYVKNDFKFKLNFKKILMIYLVFIMFLFPILGLLSGGTMTETIKGVSREINLDNLTIWERILELKLFFIGALFFLIFFLFYNFYRKKFFKNHLVFKFFPNDNKFYIYRYK